MEECTLQIRKNKKEREMKGRHKLDLCKSTDDGYLSDIAFIHITTMKIVLSMIKTNKQKNNTSTNQLQLPNKWIAIKYLGMVMGRV